MIGFISGEVVDTIGSTVILENNGLGYEITVSNSTLVRISQSTNFIKLYTYLNVRDDGLFLFGFYTKEEKNMFLKLITISGVGPKAAMSILSGMEITELALAIISSDVKAISKVKGVGKKTAERIILELRENINIDMPQLMNNMPAGEYANKNIQDAVEALKNLGINAQDAQTAVNNAAKEVSTIEEIVALALRKLG
ncbi:MAG: Holliday junction branch migration protein RuvA [Clostridia bacterium]